MRARRPPRVPEVDEGPQIYGLGIPTVSDAGVHGPAAVIVGKVVGQHLRHGVPVASREARIEARIYLARRVFQPRRCPAELVELGDRGVEVFLVEDFAAVDQVAVDRQNGVLLHLGFEALLRGPRRHVRDDRSQVGQPMHCLDMPADVREEVPRSTDIGGHFTGLDGCEQPVVDIHPVGRRRG